MLWFGAWCEIVIRQKAYSECWEERGVKYDCKKKFNTVDVWLSCGLLSHSRFSCSDSCMCYVEEEQLYCFFRQRSEIDTLVVLLSSPSADDLHTAKHSYATGERLYIILLHSGCEKHACYATGYAK